MIELKGIKKAFGEKEVLRGVDLTIPTGSTTCVIGKSGSGKSVLLKHIVGLLHADAGTLIIDGKDIETIHRKELFELRKKIGYVFQGAALFDSLTVFENVVISLVEHGIKDAETLESEARRVLSSVGLIPDLEEDGTPMFEREYQMLREKKPSSLSGGMKKRVGVARALVGSPDYIFYDEPTTGLDPVTSQQIDDLIGDLAQKLNVTSLVITHDMFSIFNIADNVAMLVGGVVRFQGDVPALRACEDEAVVDFLSRYVAEGF